MGRLIFLYGAPASGKTTLGRRLADALRCGFVDLDEVISAAAGKTIPEIFASGGEETFRDLETEALFSLADGSSGRRVVALGGGTLLRDRNREFCESRGDVLCLEAPSDEELARRIGSAAGSRPLGNRARERAGHYASFQRRVADWFDLGDSLVVVGRGIAPSFLDGLPVAADETVAGLWSGRIGLSPFATVPSGERWKTPATVERLWGAFAKRGLGRRDTVAALGGGVTGDLVGFAAATFMRGIDWVNVPTTLLSMVDASTGGKTGCDLPEGKNLAGAFHSPQLVAIDADFLSTLPPELLSAGRAEMVKHEIIGGVQRPMPAAGGAAALPEPGEIARNLAVKVGIVKEDPFEKNGRRLLLNCGHTVAHAVETLSGYGVSHGEAVAIGCVAEARLAVRLGLASASWPEELAARFAAWGLLTEPPPGIGAEAAVAVMKQDKKKSGSVVAFALPCGWGDVRATPVDLDRQEVFEW